MDDFEAHNSRWRVALILLSTVGFVALGLWMIGTFGDVPHTRRYSAAFSLGVGWACICFFGLCAIVGARRFFDSGAQLQIGRSGIRWSPWSDQLIPWSEIRDVTTWSYKGQQAIILHLVNPARFPGYGLKAKLAPANRLLTGGDIAISLRGTNRSFHDALSAISYFRG